MYHMRAGENAVEESVSAFIVDMQYAICHSIVQVHIYKLFGILTGVYSPISIAPTDPGVYSYCLLYVQCMQGVVMPIHKQDTRDISSSSCGHGMVIINSTALYAC
jgi:hypothetical protein